MNCQIENAHRNVERNQRGERAKASRTRVNVISTKPIAACTGVNTVCADNRVALASSKTAGETCYARTPSARHTTPNSRPHELICAPQRWRADSTSRVRLGRRNQQRPSHAPRKS